MGVTSKRAPLGKALMVVACATLTTAVGSAGEGCDRNSARFAGCAWLPGFGGPDLATEINALAVFDDGSGDALFAGGTFATLDGLTVNGVAKWDGSTWSALSGPSGTGVADYVYALAVFDDGNGDALYVGGQFATAGGVAVNNIAKWNGTAWFPLTGPSGTGVTNYVTALEVYGAGSGESLYVGGSFTTAGGVTANNIARWDGSTWSALIGPSATGVNAKVDALGVGDALYVGGEFTYAGGVAVNRIARWDGASWFDLTGASGTGVDGVGVNALQWFDDGGGYALYVGGWFTYAGGIPVYNIARWSGTEWSGLDGPSGLGTLLPVMALAVYSDGSQDVLYVGGNFFVAGGLTVNHIAKWDGTEFSGLAGPSGTGLDGNVFALAVHNDGSGGDALFAAGNATSAGGLPVKKIAKWGCTLFSDGFESGNTSMWSLAFP